MTDQRRPHVSRTARLLGYAGLLPQVAAVALLGGTGLNGPSPAYFAAAIYGAAILSFLGGIWWGFAMSRERGQGALAVAAVLPSLVAAALLWGALATFSPWALVALGAAIIATLPVDRRLAATGEAPAGWMGLRTPLSLGLGGLTVLAGLLAA